jgi:ferredoxin
VVSERCVRCGVCVRSCPVEAIAWQENGYPLVDKEKCIKCMCCHELCPSQAIDIHKSFIARRVMR